MADRNAAAIWIQPLPWKFSHWIIYLHLFAQERFALQRSDVAQQLRGEGFVDFPEVDIIECQTVAREQARDGVGGRHQQPFCENIHPGNFVVEQFHAWLLGGQLGKASLIGHPNGSGTVGKR